MQAAAESGKGATDNKTPAATRKKITQPQRSRQVEAADDISDEAMKNAVAEAGYEVKKIV